ncbi:hypothetical protein Tco_1065269 [Tanacetum coccineum]
MESVKKSVDKRALHKREYDSWVNERQIQITEEKVDSSKALDVSLVDTKSSGTESKEQDTSSRSGNDAHADDTDIRPIYDEEPMAEIFTSSTTKVDSEPTNGSNEDITNQYECKQTLDVSAGTLNLNAGTSFIPKKEGLGVCSELGIHDHNNEPSSSKLVPKVVPPADKTATSQQKLNLLFGPLYDEFFNAGTSSVNKSSSLSDNSKQQDTQPTATAQSTIELITPTTTITAEDNM